MGYPEVVTGTVGHYERWHPGRHTSALVDLCADREVMRFLGGPMRASAAREISARIADHWDALGFGLWAAIDLHSGDVAGFTGACRAAWHPGFAHRVEVGWRLARWSWGRGLATEGARLALEPARALGEVELLAFVHPQNVRSRAVVQRLGMRAAGVTTDPNLLHPLHIYAREALADNAPEPLPASRAPEAQPSRRPPLDDRLP